ncbi:uncharacterized protein LOC101848215 [Aplysia californica]|uniref:Uncharacterized protein LOC101848215 n=1 Tax=Aplysia californica TaxID=6500 RepID=A0ABM0JVV7_APLCA|nr:uncharacterized protein LOC101848215 [Aplysia californica]
MSDAEAEVESATSGTSAFVEPEETETTKADDLNDATNSNNNNLNDAKGNSDEVEEEREQEEEDAPKEGKDSDIGPVTLLQEGTEFDSYDAFQVTLQQYSDTSFAQFARSDSSTVERSNNNSAGGARDYNPDIIYTHVTFTCVYGGKKAPSRSNGIRNCSSRKCGCPVRLRLAATPDGQRLVIKESKLDCHNHELSEETYRFKSLDEETELEIYNLISMHENKRLARMLVRDKLAKETGKDVKMKDINNIEKRVSKRLEKMAENGDSAKEEQESMDGTDEKRTDKSDEEEEQEGGSQKETSSNKASPARPKRRIREPRRFRDMQGSRNSAASDSVAAVASGDEEEKTVTVKTPRVALTRVKTEPARSETTPHVGEKRGRKRKVQAEPEPDVQTSASATEGDRRSEIRERKLAIQEELLVLEKKKMRMLQDIMLKLTHIQENMEKR